MQRVWNFPIDTKQGCPQDRESSGHVGIRVKKKISHIFIRVQTDTSVCVCVCVCARMRICINKFSFCYVFQDVGGMGGLDKAEERKLLPALWWCVHSPCFSHQHWPEPSTDSAVTCDDGEGRNGNY